MLGKHLCGICKEVIHFAHEAYGCELCPLWIHANCAFPNASEYELKTLFKFNAGFDIICRSSKKRPKEKNEELSKDVEEIKSLLTSLSPVNFDASKLKDMQNEVLQDVLANIRPQNDENFSSVSSTTPQTKHSILLKPEANSENPDTIYTQETWTEVIKTKLPKIPVNKVVLTKNGLGYISFPDQNSRKIHGSSVP